MEGSWTIGLKNKGQSNNFETIDAATDALFLKGLSGPISFEFTDAEYTVASRSTFSPAWDLSTAIMNLGYNKETGTYYTITFKPSIDKAVTRGSIKINLQSANGDWRIYGTIIIFIKY